MYWKRKIKKVKRDEGVKGILVAYCLGIGKSRTIKMGRAQKGREGNGKNWAVGRKVRSKKSNFYMMVFKHQTHLAKPKNDTEQNIVQ